MRFAVLAAVPAVLAIAACLYARRVRRRVAAVNAEARAAVAERETRLVVSVTPQVASQLHDDFPEYSRGGGPGRGVNADFAFASHQMSDPFGDATVEWNPTNEQIITYLLQDICPAGEPHTGNDPTQDHGHTHCMWLGLAVQRLRELSALSVQPVRPRLGADVAATSGSPAVAATEPPKDAA